MNTMKNPVEIIVVHVKLGTNHGILEYTPPKLILTPLMAIGNYSYQFLICCPRDAVSRTANEKLVTIVANGH